MSDSTVLEAEAPEEVPDADRDRPDKRRRMVERVEWLRWIVQPVVALGAGFAVFYYAENGDITKRAANQINRDNMQSLTIEHLKLSVYAALIVVVIAIPLGILLTRGGFRRFSPIARSVANLGQGAPAVGLIVLAAIWWERGFWPAVVALSVYGLLPVLANTIVGIEQVDQRTIEAGRGMGMSALDVLVRIELRLAVPVILAGVRLALVLIVGTATLAAFIGAGGLGSMITGGIKLSQENVLTCGAVLVSALALLVDWVGRMVEEIARPRGMR
jgi:osmoprotectant transport system permease protein